jgi:hypothetical protein
MGSLIVLQHLGGSGHYGKEAVGIFEGVKHGYTNERKRLYDPNSISRTWFIVLRG